jgi:polyvinyl alcohol dehydrogenase (cytochrome)
MLALFLACSASWAQNINGSAIFERSCAGCHRPDSGTRAPLPEVLRQMSRDSVLRALVSGKMKFQGDSLSEAERAALVTYLAAPNDPVTQPHPVGCAPKPMQVVDDPGWNGWGVDASNSRFQPVSAGGLDRGSVPKLKLRWAFAFPGASSTFGQPTVLGGRVFVGSEDGTVYSLDARTGCTYWVYKALTTVKTAVFIAQDGHSIYFGDTGGNVYALDATSGSLLWRTAVDPHPAARITGSPLLLNDRLYVPVSSGEEGAATDPRYPCCTFRGSVVALEARTGRQIWKTYTIPDLPKPTGRRSSAGIRLWGPSGAAVWSPPTADPKARAIYVATGNSYSDPISPSSDAVMAFDMDTGKVLWSQQLTPDDSWNIACIAPDRSNCPDKPGDDYDFGAPPILASARDGSRLLIVGQKSGVIHALDPDRAGRIVWQTRIGHGGPLGGVEWGGGADEKFVYYPRSDWEDSKFDAGGGLFALDISTGEKVWYTPPAKPTCGNNPGCSAAQMAPVTVIPGVVFSGSLDGHLRAYDSSDGQVIWDFDAARDFQAVNAAKAQGGSFNGAGPTVAGAMLYVQSGYTNDIAGNVLLAFSINGK